MESIVQKPTIQDLYSFTLTLNTIEDFDATLACIVAFTRESLACRRVSIMLLDGDVLRIRAAEGVPEDVVESTRIPIGERISGEVFRSGQAVLVKDVDSLPYVERTVNSESKSFISMPILYAGLSAPDQPLGIINVTERVGNLPFTEEDLEFLTYVANTASIAVFNQITRIGLQAAYDDANAQADILAEVNGRLQSLEQLKTDFLSFIAHELQTPLSEMSAVGLIDGCQDSRDQAEMIDVLRAGYERLGGFIKKALEYFEWVGTGSVITSQTTDLGALARRVASEVAAAAAGGVDLRVSCPEQSCAVRMTERELASVLRILLDNALKFSPGERSIRVEIVPGPERVGLTVADRGRGFPSEWALEIFRPFTIVDAMHHSQGTVLNLAMAKAIIEAFGGSIRAESAGIGMGARFVIELPTPERSDSPHDGRTNINYSLKVSR